MGRCSRESVARHQIHSNSRRGWLDQKPEDSAERSPWDPRLTASVSHNLFIRLMLLTDQRFELLVTLAEVIFGEEKDIIVYQVPFCPVWERSQLAVGETVSSNVMASLTTYGGINGATPGISKASAKLQTFAWDNVAKAFYHGPEAVKTDRRMQDYIDRENGLPVESRPGSSTYQDMASAMAQYCKDCIEL